MTKEGTLADVNPFRYRGYYYDSETGMYYLNSRYYDPEVGRFLNADSQLNTQSGVIGINLFSYCENHPTTRGDSNGNLWKNIVWKTIISVVKAVCMVKEIKRIKKEIRSMPRPTKNITSSFRSTLKRNANTIKSEKKNNGIVKSGLNFYN